MKSHIMKLKKTKPEHINKDKINFIYAGEIFSKLRDINPFIEALKNIKEKIKKVYNKLNVIVFWEY